MDFNGLWRDDEFRKNLKMLGIALVVVLLAVILLNINWGKKVETFVDNTGPKIVRVTSNNMDGNYTINQTIEIVVEFNEEIFLSLDGDNPRLALKLDNDVVKYAEFVDNNSRTEMVFRYVVSKGDSVRRLDYLSEDSLEANGCTVRDRYGNVASLLLPLTSTDNSLSGNKNISFETNDPYAYIVESQISQELKEFTIIFNRKVDGFTFEDIDVYNGSKNNFRAVEENRIYKVDVSRSTTADQTIVVKANSCTDIENGIPNTSSVPIPRGFYYVGGVKENGVVISDSSKDSNYNFYQSGVITSFCDSAGSGNQFVWVPLDYIHDTSGTYKSKQKVVENSRFGARDFKVYSEGITSFSDRSEDLSEGLVNSINKYDGFYVGRYEGVLGQDTKMGSKKSVRNSTGYVGRLQNRDKESILALYNYVDASSASQAINKLYSAQASVVSHLAYGAEYDTVFEWFDENGFDVDEDSTSWGNFANSAIPSHKLANQQDILNTGLSDYTEKLHIFDLAGNLWEWTQEKTKQGNVARGGYYGATGFLTPAATRVAFGNSANTFLCTGRVFLYVK